MMAHQLKIFDDVVVLFYGLCSTFWILTVLKGAGNVREIKVNRTESIWRKN